MKLNSIWRTNIALILILLNFKNYFIMERLRFFFRFIFASILRICLYTSKIKIVQNKKLNKMKYPTSPTPSESGSMLSGYSFRSGRSNLPRPATATLCSSATMKTSKYLRRLIKFRQMDFEFALWQMLYLFVAPQKVYRNFGYRKGSLAGCITDDS